MTLYIDNPKDATRKLLELINEFSKVAGYKINAQKSPAFQQERLVSKPPESPSPALPFLQKKMTISPSVPIWKAMCYLPPKCHSPERGQDTLHLLATPHLLLLLLPSRLPLVLSYSTLQISIVLNLLLFFILKR